MNPKLKARMTVLYQGPIVRFLAVGGANFLVTYAVYLAALLVVEYRFAFGIAFVTGLIFTSTLNIRHAFTEHLTVPVLLVYGIYYLVYSFVNLRTTEILVENYGVDAKWALLLSLTVLTPVHYLLSKALVKRFQSFGNAGSSKIP